MSEFSKLKQQRKAKEAKCYTLKEISTSQTPNEPSNQLEPRFMNDPDMVPTHTTHTTGPISLNSNGLYTAIPSVLDVRVNEGRPENGRGVYSKIHWKPGEVLISVKPHVAALSNDNLEAYCSSCFGPGSGSLSRCTGCKAILYCDSKCQNTDWAFHKQECMAIQGWCSSEAATSGAPTLPGDAIRCLGRILWKRRKLGRESVWSREIDALQSHRTSLTKDPNAHDSQVHTHLAHAIVRFLGLTSPQELAEFSVFGAADLVDLVSRFTTNTFTISTPSLTPIGACVSPIVALINHSCDPNAVVVFPRAGGESRKDQEPLMQVVALKYIAPDEEILTAYIDTTLPRERRQKLLKDTYHFTCRCRLCVPPMDSPIDWREVMWCPKTCGGVCPLPTEETSLVRCSKCKTPVRDTDAVLDAIRVGQEALDKAETLQFSNPQKSLQLTTNLIPIVISAGLVPAAHPLLALSRLNTSLLITHLPIAEPLTEEIRSPQLQADLQDTPQRLSQRDVQEALDEAIRSATRSNTGLGQILTEGHPIRGIALAELGKLLSVDEPHPTHMIPPQSGPTTPASLSSSSSSSMIVPPAYPPSGPQRLKLAYETLKKARSELMIGFGGGSNEGGEVGQNVRRQVAELEKELAVWKTGLRNVYEDRPKMMR
ncbi:SET domain-containing protein [Phlegmacium glaucopus]|nr:SET domain-containing protein [Phlegmacium glaucopus]